jgi:hypothetical protein
MFFEDVAGIQARLDNILELYPIDMGYDHFTLNNVRYHGADLTVVWQRPGGTTFYPNAPAGYTVYLNGLRAFTVSDLAHVSWNSSTGAVSVLDGSATQVLFNAARTLNTATQVSLSGNARVVDAFQKEGLNLTNSAPNLAVGRATSASFTTASPTAQATSTANAVDGFTISGLPVTSGSYVGRNRSGELRYAQRSGLVPNRPRRAAPVQHREALLLQQQGVWLGWQHLRSADELHRAGLQWLRLGGRVCAGEVTEHASANYNVVTFPAVTAQLVRINMTHATSRGVGLKEVQVYQI